MTEPAAARRYVSVVILIAVIAAAALSLELIFRVAGGSLSIYHKSGAGLVLLYLLGLVVVGLFMKVAAPVGLGRYVRLYWAHRRAAAVGFLTMFCLASLAIVAFYVGLASVGHLRWSADAGERLGFGLVGTLALGIVAACFVAIFEEVLFRGFLTSYLRWSAGGAVTLAAVLSSALLFAAAHNIRDPLAWFTQGELPLFVGLTLLGILLAVTYLETGSLWCSIGLHSALLAVGEVFLRRDLVVIDFAAWWLGGTGDIRRAPVVWAMFVAATIIVLARRRWLHERLAVEDFVGMPLIAEPRPGTPG